MPYIFFTIGNSNLEISLVYL